MVPDFFPFPGLRYAPDLPGAPLERLTAPPYDVIDAELRARLEAAHARNAVHVILPRDSAPGDRYRRAAGLFRAWQADGVLVADSAHFYVYRTTFDEAGTRRVTTGVLGALAVSPPEAGAVLPHERTMPKPRGDRLELLRAVRANLDPVWCLSLAGGLADLLTPDGDPVAHSTDGDGVAHELFLLPPERNTAVSELVASAPAVIADGHHRYETALAFAAEGGPGAGRIMTLVTELSSDQLTVGPIHRLLARAPGLRARLGETCDLSPVADAADASAIMAAMATEEAMAIIDGAGAALVRPRPGALDPALHHLPAALRTVDSARLDAALGDGVEFGYHHHAGTVIAEVAKGAADAAVLIRPVSVPQIAAVAATGVPMPAKSTFFRPKPLTGMVFRALPA